MGGKGYEGGVMDKAVRGSVRVVNNGRLRMEEGPDERLAAI